MELGLRLGNGSSPFGFHQKSPSNNTPNHVNSHIPLDFCLGFSSIHPPLQQDPPPPPLPPPGLHLDILPPTPVAASRRSSQTDVSEGWSPPAVFRDVISRAPPSATAEGGGGILFELEDQGNSYSERDEEDQDQNLGSRKKLRLSRQQSAVLEESFKEHHALYPKQKLEVARRLNLRPRQVEVWFQNRRARTKLKQTEVDCEYLKKCCTTLTQQNTKLRKELQDLRALKTTDDSLFMRSPATTLTMCASCERAVATCGGKQPVNSKPSGFSFPFSPTQPPSSTHNN